MIRRGSTRLDGVFQFFLFGDFRRFGDFLVVDLRPFSLGFGGGCMHEPLVVLFTLFPIPNQ
jgi:hypothetical protein